ncbi:hypothetical protein HDU98_009094 [Podochytrium sp. JEL0797]|nr:hypothetical protein HDU98_009094 [Podochytrium sp. JEL0797]
MLLSCRSLLLIAFTLCASSEPSQPSPPSPRRIVAVGDIHGDLPSAHKVFRMANLVDEHLQWTATPSTTFVQVGDVVDRGPDTIELFSLFRRLYNESIAPRSEPHSEIYPLLGNHEIMNLSGDLRSVSQADYESFGGKEARMQAWHENGWIGQLLMNTLSNVTVMVEGTRGGTGIRPEWARIGIDGMNAQVKFAMQMKDWENPIFTRNGPFWYRGYANETESTICGELQEALTILNAKRMVIGHTPQLETGEILSRCNGKVFVIDVGITARYGRNCAALEIVGDTVTGLYCVPGRPDEARRVDMTPKGIEKGHEFLKMLNSLWRTRSADSQDDQQSIPSVTRQPDPQPGSFKRSDALPAIRTLASNEDFTWKQLPGTSETFTFYMSLENGIFVLVQLVWSYMGLRPEVMVVCRVYHPDGSREGKSIQHSSSSLKLSEDKLSASCGEMEITFVPSTKGYRVHYLADDAQFDFDFVPTDDTFKVGNGQAFFGKDERDGYAQAAFMPKAAVTGAMTTAGASLECKGSGLFHHVVQCRPQNVQQWNFINFQNEKDALMLYEFELPKYSASGSLVTSQGCLIRNGKTIAITTDNRAFHVQTATDSMSKYEVPTQIFAVWKGKTLESGIDVTIEISTMLENSLERIDVLGELPFLLRKFIQTFVTAPFVFSWYERKLVAKITVGDEVSEIEGDAFIECCFLSKSK